MSTIVDMDEARARRADRRAAHPSLRWIAGATFYVAHRKDGDEAACGARGDLTLAPPGVPLCVRCFPPESVAT